jgi:hypothetical protein
MTIYLDKHGKQITHEQMLELAIDKDYCRVKKTEIAHIDGDERIEVSTVWLPGSITIDGKKPIFETMIFGGPEDQWQKRYSDIEEAKRGHDFAIHLCTGMRAQDKWSS